MPGEPWTEIRRLRGVFENYVTATSSVSNARRLSAALEAFFSRFKDRKHPIEFTRPDIEDYKVIRLKEGVNPSTINFELHTLSRFYTWLMDMELVNWNPARQTKKLRQKETKRTSMTLADQHKLVQGIFCWQDRALVALALATGLRGATLCALERSMINFENKSLDVPAAIMKTGRYHSVPLPDWALEVLKEAPEGRIFEGYAKNALGISYRWNRICERAGLPATGIRTARRTFATTLLRSGADLRTVQDLMGHRSILTTSKYITPADSAVTRAAVERLPNLSNV